MAQVSDWSTIEEQNVKLDDLTLSGEGGLYSNKIMCAVKKKFDDVDGKLSKVQGAYVFKGTKADMTALEAVTSPAVGDVYSVTALGGENYAWDGTAWDSLGTSDANVVHKTGAETVAGQKTFVDGIVLAGNVKRDVATSALSLLGGSGFFNGARLQLFGSSHATTPGQFNLVACTANEAESYSELVGTVDGSLSWAGQSIETTSDERLKTALSIVPDKVLDAWGDVQWGQFRYLDAVERKGESARLHLGLIAQRVKDVFERHGLDACTYGILCHKTAGDADLWLVRYAEAQAMEAAYQRRRADRLEERIEALEAKLDGKQQ